MTDEAAASWAAMGLSQTWQIKRLTDWANMLEKRVAELDQNYRSYPYGRTDNTKKLPAALAETIMIPHLYV